MPLIIITDGHSDHVSTYFSIDTRKDFSNFSTLGIYKIITTLFKQLSLEASSSEAAEEDKDEMPPLVITDRHSDHVSTYFSIDPAK